MLKPMPASAEREGMVLTVVLFAVLGYFALALPVAMVIGRSLRTPVEPYVAEPVPAFAPASASA